MHSTSIRVCKKKKLVLTRVFAVAPSFHYIHVGKAFFNSSEDSIELLGSINTNDLTFSLSNNHTSINYGNDLLAIVQNANSADLNFI